MHIKISGNVTLKLTLQTTELYTAEASVNWSTNVTVQTIGSSIKVNTLGSHDPTFSSAHFSEGAAAKFRNPMDMLKEAFPRKIDLDELVQEISAFEGNWQYYFPLMNTYSLASPVFNDDGDLLFELRRHSAHTVSRMPSVTGSLLGSTSSAGRPHSPALWSRLISRGSRSSLGSTIGAIAGGQHAAHATAVATHVETTETITVTNGKSTTKRVSNGSTPPPKVEGGVPAAA
uniref:Nucleoside diphosphate kinase (NDK) (NDP kinase) ) n=1 Tax=Ganoderma boninense TaxID=34458 RepID=A0A5K1JV23_9APHY|nr:Nucleoside diphosphate kinase (NDK) (NDP kinase) (EC (Nucleoside-2-P kinase) [Ganoderma boninense]